LLHWNEKILEKKTRYINFWNSRGISLIIFSSPTLTFLDPSCGQQPYPRGHADVLKSLTIWDLKVHFTTVRWTRLQALSIFLCSKSCCKVIFEFSKYQDLDKMEPLSVFSSSIKDLFETYFLNSQIYECKMLKIEKMSPKIKA